MIHPNLIKILHGVGLTSLSDEEVRQYRERYSGTREVRDKLREMERNQPSLWNNRFAAFNSFYKSGVDYLTNQPKHRQLVDERYIWALRAYLLDSEDMSFQ
ncbi:hypothetical protein J4438_02660 [Candidatus Woesearchaeota archaeon]|nr:hypothetical protein [Candidatus Woesearchaeota archaeon]